jgi:hypothetical protein
MSDFKDIGWMDDFPHSWNLMDHPCDFDGGSTVQHLDQHFNILIDNLFVIVPVIHLVYYTQFFMDTFLDTCFGFLLTLFFVSWFIDSFLVCRFLE